MRMEHLQITEEDLVEKFILASGKGGQKINKTSSCVYLKHLPSKIEIKCQKERSRELNRFFARRELCDQFEKIQLGIESKKEKEISQIRRQKARKSRKQKQKMIEDKKHLSEKKEFRKTPHPH